MAEQIAVEVDDTQDVAPLVASVYDGVESAVRDANYRVPFQLIAKEIERFEETLFETEKAPDGTPWAPNRPSTVKRKGHDVVLHGLTGRLGTSLFQQTGDSVRDADASFLTFGTSVEYSGFLTDGTRNMPAREHVGLNDEMCDLAAEYIADGTVVALGGVP